MPPYNYNVSPGPTSGQGIYGRVPGQVTLPRPAADLGNQVPNLRQLNSTLSGDIMSGLQGQLSPGTQQALQDFNAAWGVGSGMPGSGLATNRLGRNIGRFSEDLKNTAIGQYNQTVPTISHTQTVDPSLQYTIADRNSVFGAAPDPTAAGSHAEQLYNQYLQSLASRGGAVRGPGGGTGFAGGNPSAGPAAADSMGETVIGYAGGQPSTFAGSSSPGQDPWMDQFNSDFYGGGTGGGNQPVTADEISYFD